MRRVVFGSPEVGVSLGHGVESLMRSGAAEWGELETSSEDFYGVNGDRSAYPVTF